MPLITIIIVLIIVGMLLWLLTFLPIDGRIRQIITGLAIFCVVLWLITILVPGLGNIRIGH